MHKPTLKRQAVTTRAASASGNIPSSIIAAGRPSDGVARPIIARA